MEQSFNDRGLQIYFVKQSDSPHTSFTEAFDSCEEKLIRPKYIDDKECLKLRLDRKVVLVLETFQGPLFNHLRKTPCAILGAPCILECLSKGEPTPDDPHPVFSQAMNGLRVCVSGFTPAQKEDLKDKIAFMGGGFEKNLHAEVTHLVVTKTNTDKYQLAADHKIPVMLESWIHETWAENQIKHKSALDEPLNALICPPFHGLNITVTQFQKHKKDKIKTIIEQNGGKFSPALTSEETDILVVANPSGDKFRHAKQWNIPCVSESWISESAKAGYSLRIPDFEVKNQTKTSTPDRDTTQVLMDISCISSIAPENKKTQVDETLMASFVEPFPRDRREPPATPEKEPDASVSLLKMTVGEVRKAGLFLDGCKVYVSGGAPPLQDKLRKILNNGGATRFDDISESLSHIILAGASLQAAEAKELAKLSRRPPVVPLSWLLKSLELKHPAEAVGQQGAEPPSPLSKRGMQMFETAPKIAISPRTARNDLAVVQQYLSSKPQSPSEKDEPDVAPVEEEEEEEELARPLGIMEGVKVQLKGLSKAEAAEARLNVEQLGGKIVASDPDYIVGPFQVAAMSANQVNFYWLEECAEKDELVAVEYYHKPIIRRPRKPLQGVVVAVSSYGGRERAYLSSLATELGAVYQDVFAKKAAADRGAVASTHLVCPFPEGSKFKAAVKWRLPAVTKDWLLQCAEANSRVPEEPYLLSGQAPSPSGSVAPSPSASVLSNSNTSIRREDLETPIRTVAGTSAAADTEFATPVRPMPAVNFATPFTPFSPATYKKGDVNDDEEKREAERIARLSIRSYRKEVERLDPDYMSTPETPYGSVVQEDPSPNTRKKWKRYLNSIPDNVNSEEMEEYREKVNKRMRREALDEDEGELGLKTPKIRRHETSETFDSDIDEELLKNYGTQKEVEEEKEVNEVKEQEGEEEVDIPPELEKENLEVTVAASTSNVSEPAPDVSSEKRQRIFMVTGVIERDVDHMMMVVSQLGGSMSELKNFDKTATHLVTTFPSRSEKLLAAMAAGLWVVHPQFLLQSAKAGKFLPEEGFEWGNPAAASILDPILEGNILGRELAAACHRWRNQAATKGGAFSQFKAVLIGTPQKIPAFERMIMAGGGQIVPLNGDLTGVTHCFVDMKLTVDLTALRDANVPCYNPIFLSDYLIKPEGHNTSSHRIQ